MTTRQPPCPWLPDVGETLDFSVTRRHGGERGASFYRDALRYAQSLWLEGKPAQAVLQLNKAWMARFSGCHPVLSEFPPPYRALCWLLAHSADGACGYLGDPVRHFQHLASRMSGPDRGIRAWRAWYCLHLAERVLPAAGFCRDGCQLAREGLWVPAVGRALAAIAAEGWPGEAAAARTAWLEVGSTPV